MRSIVALNLQSYGSGSHPWGNLKPDYLEMRGFVEAHCDDGLIEIFGFKQGWHASFVMAESAKHIAQGLEARISPGFLPTQGLMTAPEQVVPPSDEAMKTVEEDLMTTEEASETVAEIREMLVLDLGDSKQSETLLEITEGSEKRRSVMTMMRLRCIVRVKHGRLLFCQRWVCRSTKWW